MERLIIDIAVAVVLCRGGNQVTANSAGKALEAAIPIPFKICPKFINLNDNNKKNLPWDINFIVLTIQIIIHQNDTKHKIDPQSL